MSQTWNSNSNSFIGLFGFRNGEMDPTHLHTSLPAGVDIFCGIADSDCTDDLSVRERIDLSRMARDA